MAAMVFVDIVAYAGAAMGVLLLLCVGCILIHPGTANRAMGAFISERQARRCLEDGSFRPARARALGMLLLLFATFMAVCIVRSTQHV